MLDLLVLLLTAVAVFFLTAIVVLVLSRAYARYEERYLAKRISDLSEMFFFVDARQLLILTVAASAIGAALGVLLLGPVLTVLLTAFGLASPTLLVRFYRARRIKLFDRQLVDALGSMASALRAGMTLYQAMEEVSRSTLPPLAQEFALTVREMRLGTPTDDAFDNLAKRVGSDDLKLVVTAVTTARGLGGNMAEIFDTLAATTRERFRIEGRIRALTAQGRLQGIVVGLMPVAVWLAFDAVRPDLTRPMMHHWFGYVMVTVIAIMEILGFFFLRRIVAIKI
jgi:tight adherence protein B